MAKFAKKSKQATEDTPFNAEASEGKAPKKASKKSAVKKATGVVKKASKKEATSEVAPDTRKIKLLVKENPKREGSAAYERFELYSSSKTVQDFKDAGGKAADLTHDEQKGFIEVK